MQPVEWRSLLTARISIASPSPLPPRYLCEYRHSVHESRAKDRGLRLELAAEHAGARGAHVSHLAAAEDLRYGGGLGAWMRRSKGGPQAVAYSFCAGEGSEWSARERPWLFACPTCGHPQRQGPRSSLPALEMPSTLINILKDTGLRRLPIGLFSSHVCVGMNDRVLTFTEVRSKMVTKTSGSLCISLDTVRFSGSTAHCKQEAVSRL